MGLGTQENRENFKLKGAMTGLIKIEWVCW